MRIFVSSTCHDLVDIRAELGNQLRELGLFPVLSDDKLSDFVVANDTNSIKTCLVNVESCDEMLLVLDRRYGPRLGKAGFDNISATHLEYQHAVKHGVPVHVFVRDRTVADYSTWKDNRKTNSDINLCWVDAKNRGLFEILDQHKKLTASDLPNWFHTFSNSIDLKAAIEKIYRKRLLPAQLADAIDNRQFPVIAADIEADVNEPEHLQDPGSSRIKVTLTNVGGRVAFGLRTYWENEGPQGEAMVNEILASEKSISRSVIHRPEIFGEGWEGFLVAEYYSGLGIFVIDRFEFGHDWNGRFNRTKKILAERRYFYSTKPELKIEEKPET